MSGGLLALTQHPDQEKMLRADPSLLQGAVDEMVRWTTPATGLLRVATAATTLGGQEIATDDWLVMFLDSANQDETVFSEPHRF